MRKALLSVTPFVLTAAVFGQAASRSTATAAPAKQAAASPAGANSAGAAANAPAPPEHPLTDAQAHEIMELTGTDKIKEQLVTNATAYFKRSFPPYMPKDVLEDITASLEKADVNTPVVAIYKRYLSTEDATKAIEFYRTPSGKDLIKATPQILSEAQRSAGQTAQGIVREALDRHKPEIEAAQKTYQQEHATPTLGSPSPGAKTPGAGAGTGTTTPKPTTPPATKPQS